MTLRVNDADLARIYAHGRATYPEECCGVMIGSLEGQQIVIDEVISAENERDDENRHNRFLISPQVLLSAQRRARENNMDVLGYYHSHPDHPARPSEFDREHAWPGISYMIISVAKGEVADARSWRLTDDRSRFDEEDLIGENGELVTV